MSKRFGRQQKRKAMAEIERLKSMVTGDVALKGLVQWPHLWDHFGMSKNKKGRWFTSYRTPDFVVEFLNDYGYTHTNEYGETWNGMNAGQLAVACLNRGFAKVVVNNDHALACKLGLV